MTRNLSTPRHLNYGQEALSRISKWLASGRLVIDPDTQDWIWHGALNNGVPVMRYGGKVIPIKVFLFKSFYNRFRIIDPVRRICNTNGCLNPLHHYTTKFIDLNYDIEYTATVAQAKVIFASHENPVGCYGIYDVFDTPKESEEYVKLDSELKDKSDADLLLLKLTIPEYKSVRILKPIEPIIITDEDSPILPPSIEE